MLNFISIGITAAGTAPDSDGIPILRIFLKGINPPMVAKIE